MTLHAIRNANKLNEKGEYDIVYEAVTICDDCITDKNYGYDEYVEDVPGDKCEICDYTE
jgi:hypothetical protein